MQSRSPTWSLYRVELENCFEILSTSGEISGQDQPLFVVAKGSDPITSVLPSLTIGVVVLMTILVVARYLPPRTM